MAGDHTNRGKWSQSGVPHKGWSCTGVEDLGEPSVVCEMCESVEIRYVHYMEHPDFGEALGVGCVCAEHMEDDYLRPRERESKLRMAARRRGNWQKRSWNISQSDNFYLNTDGFNIQVYRVSGNSRAWMIAVVNRASLNRRQGRKSYQSGDDAKRAAFDALLWAKDHLN